MQGYVLSPTPLIGSRICSGAVRPTRSFNFCPTMASTLPNPTSTEDLSGIAANIKEITTPSDFQHTGTSALKLPAKSGSNFFDDILTSVFQIGGKLLWPNDNVSSNPPSPQHPQQVKPRWLDGFIRQSKFGRTRDRIPPPTRKLAIALRSKREVEIWKRNKNARPRTTIDAPTGALE